MADATPVFIAAAVVLGALAAWSVYLRVTPGPRWAEPPRAADASKAQGTPPSEG